MDYQVINLIGSSTSRIDQGIYINTVTTGIPPNSPEAKGIYFSIQLVTKHLLTEIGSNKFNPSEGCSLVTSLGRPMTPTLLRNLSTEVTLLLDRAMTLITLYQDESELPDEERVYGLQLEEFYFDSANTALIIKIRFKVIGGSIVVQLTSRTLETM